MQIIDSHCHLQGKYEKDLSSVIERAQALNIGMICIGTDYETSKQGIEIAQQYPDVWAAVGLHPNDNPTEYFDESAYEALLKMPKVVAMGEIGLDYYRTPDPEHQRLQKERFEKQLALAVRMNLPVVLHSRDAAKGSLGKVHADTLEILNAQYAIHNAGPRGVAHSFTGTIEEAKKYIDLGFYLGFNGIITFARQYDEMIKFVPLDRILLETDAPFLTPEPYRGKPNEPSYIVEVAKKLAQLKGESYENIVSQTTENTKKLFRI